ncbi:MAG: FolC bifunctional protein [Crocinitomicaceae bacterium]|jgi:dihydrofolate synthase/folylpolyglutamate synthase|nr:FolC bifunctional protein [Crocinitomicaceae bacterium]
MTYAESVDWLFSQFPAYQKVGASAYKPDLDNVLALCDYYKVDYSHLNFIHIAGTNGKGSAANYLASILQENGQNTGLFTSPHILDFRERIRVNGIMIPEEKVIAFCERVRQSDFTVMPSFFEITWILALQHFLDENCEICVIETGLGGRLDATNIITPILSYISNIGLDHTAILGNTVEKIAAEKAGIIKANVPVLIGEYNPKTQPVFEDKANEVNAPLFWSDDFHFDSYIFPEGTYLRKNEHKVRSLVQVLNTLNFLISHEECDRGFLNVARNTGFRGRFQQLSQKPLSFIDAAHNADGVAQLMLSIRQYSYKQLHVIYGATNDKDVSSILKLFPENTHFYLCPFNNMRSLSLDELYKLKEQLPYNIRIFNKIEEASNFAQETVNENDMLLITGSFFLLSDFFEFFSKKGLPD